MSLREKIVYELACEINGPSEANFRTADAILSVCEEEIADLRRQLKDERDKALEEAIKVCRRVSERYHDQFAGSRDIYLEGCSDGAMDCLEEIIVLQKETNKWTP